MEEKPKEFLNKFTQKAQEAMNSEAAQKAKGFAGTAVQKAQEAMGSEAAQKAKGFADTAVQKAQEAMNSETAQKAKEMAGAAAQQAQKAVAEAVTETAGQAKQVYAQAAAGEGIAAVKKARLSKKTIITLAVLVVAVLAVLGVVGSMFGGGGGSKPHDAAGLVQAVSKKGGGSVALEHVQDNVYKVQENGQTTDIWVQFRMLDGKLDQITSTADSGYTNEGIAFCLFSALNPKLSDEDVLRLMAQSTNRQVLLDGVMYVYDDEQMAIFLHPTHTETAIEFQ